MIFIPRPTNHILRTTLIIMALFLSACQTSFPLKSEMDQLANIKSPLPRYEVIKAEDGTRLAYRTFAPQTQKKAILVFYHGGGAHSAAGYQQLGDELASQGIVVIMPDVRGHGYSQGKRGDTSSAKQVWDDVEQFINLAKAQYPNMPIYLGGHSSGAGLALNVLYHNKQIQVDGVVMLAPYFGYKSDTNNDENPSPFAKTDLYKFILNGMTGSWYAHSQAVHFNYPESVKKADPYILDGISITMAKALTPEKPKEELGALSQPVGVWLAENDIEFSANKVKAFVAQSNKQAKINLIPEAGHLTVLTKSSKPIGDWILAH